MSHICFNINNQRSIKIQKNMISIFESIKFKIKITTSLTETYFLDGTFNLERNTCQILIFKSAIKIIDKL